MKRKFGVVFLVLAVIITILLIVMGFAVQRYEKQRAMIEPPSHTQLTVIQRNLPLNNFWYEEKILPKEIGEAETNDAADTSELPRRLEKPIGKSGLYKTYYPHDRYKSRFNAFRFKLGESITSYVAPEEVGKWAWERGKALYELGEYDAAQRCFWIVIESDVDPFIIRYSCARLARLEEDPELAYQYMELSLQEESESVPTHLPGVVDLCVVTESYDLAVHYIERIHAIDPEYFTKYTHFRILFEEFGIAWPLL